ncbi:MAG: amidohydrolase [Alphaproteobacteria bacterium]|nr:amidohydrolase [Alphaproteobacteria bacterium]
MTVFPQAADILVLGGEILTMDGKFTSFEDGAIAISDSKIVAVGHQVDAANCEACDTINAEGMLVTPGLVNTHCHAAMTLFRGLADDVPLDLFLKTVWAAEAEHVNYNNVFAGATLGIAEMAMGGITHFVDMYMEPEATIAASRKVGISLTSGPIFMGINSVSSDEWQEQMRVADAYLSIAKDKPDVQNMIMPHSSYALDMAQLKDLVALAQKYDIRMHTHGAEAPSEMKLVAALHDGARPIDVFESAGVFAQGGTLIAHAVDLTDEEITRMADCGVSVSHCPLSNSKLASGMARVRDLRAAGVTVSLGTDGASSGNDLDLWKAMRLASFVSALLTEQPAVLPAREIFAMATREGAKALGLEDEFGTLEVGKRADIMMIDMSALHLTPSYDPYSSLVFAAGREDVCHVIANGALVVENKQLIADISSEIMQVKRVADQISV